jgi:hypothetical protein
MLYITHTRLMRESESSVYEHAASGTDHSDKACSQLISHQPRYTLWISRHDRAMLAVADAKRRERQLIELRSIAVQQIHRAALVRHLRANQITGRDRDLLLKEFFGALDPACSILAEHRNYILAASSQVCAADLLELSGDRFGLELVDRYQRDYGLYFAMHCDRARAQRSGRSYLLEGLIPEIRAEATQIREQLLSGDRLPGPRCYIHRTLSSAGD